MCLYPQICNIQLSSYMNELYMRSILILTICFDRSTWWSLTHSAWGRGSNFVVKNKDYTRLVKMMHCPRRFSCCKNKSMKILNWLTLLWKTRDWLRNLQRNIVILKFWIPNDFHCKQKTYIVTRDLLCLWSECSLFYFTDIQASELLQARGKRDVIDRDISFAESCMFTLPELLSAEVFIILHAVLINFLSVVPSYPWAEICSSS